MSRRVERLVDGPTAEANGVRVTPVVRLRVVALPTSRGAAGVASVEPVRLRIESAEGVVELAL